ncbi:MAG TPA: 2OG-Fe(II) oxygenase [Rhodanobacteraceae bacterium]|nr:2OG-Fe(II) oxygenase [Rhodanobacteraceae bacterium]
MALRDYIRWYDEALPPVFCAELINAFHASAQQHVKREPGWRSGLDDSAWTELDITPLADEAFKGFFFRQIDEFLARYNAEVGLSIPVPGSARLAEFRMKRYRPGADEKFQLHFDSINEVADRYLVFLWYLNDVAEGGETEFPDLQVKVAARAGRLLMFPPYWMYQHTGLPPRSGDKYILSTYMLFPGR